MEGVLDHLEEVTGGTDVVGEATDGGGVTVHVVVLPLAEEPDEKVALELLVEDLREEVEVGDEGSLQDDGDVRGVEQLNGVGLLVSLHFPAAHGKFNSETLYIQNK